MNNPTCIPPVWKRHEVQVCYNNRFTFSKLPYPDWCCVGPVINTPGIIDGFSHDGTEASTSRSQGHKYKLQETKDLGEKFPIEKSFKFAYPITQPKEIYESRQYVGKNNYLWLQGGNCLDIFDIQGETFVVYPEYCGDQQNIAISQMKPRTGIFENDEQGDRLFYNLNICSRLPADKFDVHQVVANEVNGQGYVLYRSKNFVQLFSLDENLNDMNIDFKFSYLQKDIITSVALSDTLPGSISIAHANGIVALFDCPLKKPIWKYKFLEENTEKQVFQCDFGRQALSSLVVNNESSVWLCDTRTKPTPGSTLNHPLFNLKDMSNYLVKSEVICKVSRSGWYHLYVVASNCILLMDERYCKIPTMKWHHMMTSNPSFVTQSKIRDHEVLMLGNRNDVKICGVSCSSSSKQEKGIYKSSLAKHFNIVRDTVQFAHQQNTWFSHHVNRMGNMFMGLASCVHPDNDQFLSLLSLNDTGDIFLQDFQLCQDNTDVSMSVHVEDYYSQIGKKLLQEWEENAIDAFMKQPKQKLVDNESDGGVRQIKQEKEESLLDPNNKCINQEVEEKEGEDDVCDASNTEPEPIRKPLHLVKFYEELEKSVPLKNKDTLMDKMLYNVEHYVANRIMPTRQMSVLVPVTDSGFPEENTSSQGLEKYIPRHLSNCIQPEYYGNCIDDISKKLLSVWQIKNEAGGMERPPFKYRRAPFDTNHVSVLPTKLELDHAHRKETMDSKFEKELLESLSVFKSPQTPARKKRRKTKSVGRVDGF